MKKIILLTLFVLCFTGCTNVNKLNYDELLNHISKKANTANTFRTGYSYYLPRNMVVANSSLYNEVIEDGKNKYYLYVDIVSYFKKVEKEYVINSKAESSKKIRYDGKFGYFEINLMKNNKYLVEIMYNYAKIEVIVDKNNINTSVLSAINILKSVEYNDSIISNLLGDDILNFNEEELNIFDTKGSESNYIKVDDSYEEVEESLPDPDLIN